MQYFTLARAPIAKWAPMVKLVDTADLKSAAFNEAYRFDSGSGHQIPMPVSAAHALTGIFHWGVGKLAG